MESVEILFANRNVTAAEDRVGRREVEEKIRQSVLKQEFGCPQRNERVPCLALEGA